jgi:predicted TIM-barrel fold metal-dependent hydrolase
MADEGKSLREPMPSRPDEAILDPDLAICDAHHHLWERIPAVPAARPYRVAELLEDAASGHRVTSTVFVECTASYRTAGPPELLPVGETEFVERVTGGVRDGTRVAAAIVGYADLRLGDRVRPVLEAHLAASPRRFRGIRHATAHDPGREVWNNHTGSPPGTLGDTAFRAGFRQLAALGLSFDAWLYHPQIPELTDLARTFPEVTIVLDHLGGPLGVGPYAGRVDEVFAAWRRAIDGLAECENVHVKLGGIHMAINGHGWDRRDPPPDSLEIADATRRYHLHAIERFGAGRCMFESNFPVDRVSGSYRTIWNAFKRIASACSDDEKAALFHDTACRVYRI